MQCNEIEQLLTEELKLAEVYVKAEGNHYAVTAMAAIKGA